MWIAECRWWLESVSQHASPPRHRWQKGKDVYWYTREKEGDAQAAREKELAMVKQREEDLMMEVWDRLLGLRDSGIVLGK